MRLTVENLACERGGRVLFAGLGFSLSAGEAVVVTGPNGSGKTSLLRLLAGLLRPSAGRVAVEGADEGADEAAIHFVGHLDGLKGALSAGENLAFAGSLLGGGGQPIEAALARLDLAALAGVPARMLSAGQRRRLALARLLVAPRPLWLLDEPTSALDADGQRTLLALLREHLAAGGLLAVATHAVLPLHEAREVKLGGDA